jgi:hypothetical protein
MLSQYARIVAARFARTVPSRNLQLELPVQPHVQMNSVALTSFFNKSRP